MQMYICRRITRTIWRDSKTNEAEIHRKNKYTRIKRKDTDKYEDKYTRKDKEDFNEGHKKTKG